jgi:hypothetical protein
MLALWNPFAMVATVREAVALDKRHHFEVIGQDARRQEASYAAAHHNRLPADSSTARLWMLWYH